MEVHCTVQKILIPTLSMEVWQMRDNRLVSGIFFIDSLL
jgi:hypothetical protein